ncbi:MAG: hypothetical protein V3V00_15070 [Saprospiraceae bacterium]
MLKYSNNLLTFIFSFIISQMLIGQAQGHISFVMTDAFSDNPQVNAQMEMMKGSTTDVFYIGDESLTINNMMGGMINIKMRVEKDAGMKMAYDMMGSKFYIPMSKTEMDKMKAEGDNPMSELQISYDESDTKQIAGFTCYKMVAIPIANPDMKIEAYITEDIKTKAALIQGVEMEQFRGFPLEIVANMGTLVMTTTAISFEASCDPSDLILDINGYTEMTFDEFVASMGQMGGGFGF